MALLAGCIGGYAFYRHQADTAEQARIAEEEAQKAAEEAARKQWEETHSTYTVLYLEKGSKKVLKAQLVVEDAEVGKTVTLTAPKVKGYELVSSKSIKLTVAKDDKDNKVVFYYAKPVDEEPEPSTGSGSDNGGSSSNTEPEEPGFILDGNL